MAYKLTWFDKGVADRSKYKSVAEATGKRKGLSGANLLEYIKGFTGMA